MCREITFQSWLWRNTKIWVRGMSSDVWGRIKWWNTRYQGTEEWKRATQKIISVLWVGLQCSKFPTDFDFHKILIIKQSKTPKLRNILCFRQLEWINTSGDQITLIFFNQDEVSFSLFLYLLLFILSPFSLPLPLSSTPPSMY